LEDEIEQSLLEELTAFDQSSCSDDDDSSGTDDLTVVEVLVSECDNESDDVQCANASSAPTALSATFTWEEVPNYVGQRDQFVDNYKPQNEAQNETHCAKLFKVFFDDQVVDVSYIVIYLDTQLKQVQGLWHHAIIIKVTCFALLVHRQALAPATITNLFFVVMKALSLLFQTPPIHGFPFFTSCHFSRYSVADQNGNCLDWELKIFC